MSRTLENPELEQDVQELTGRALVAAERPLPVIRTHEHHFEAANEALRVASQLKALEAKRIELTQPLLEGKRRIDAFFKKPMDALEAWQYKLKSAIRAYEVEKRRQEDEERAKKQATADAKAKAEREQLEADAARLRLERATFEAAQMAEAREKRWGVIAEEARLREVAEAEARKLRVAAAKSKGEEAARLRQEAKARMERENEERRVRKAEEKQRCEEEAAARAIESHRLLEEETMKRLQAESTLADKVDVKERFQRKDGVTMRKVWTWDIVRLVDVPIQFLVPDKPSITAYMRLSLSQTGEPPVVPGIRFYQDDQLAVG